MKGDSFEGIHKLLKGTNSGYTSTAYFWSAQGVQMRYCGTTAIDGFDDVIVQGSTDPKNPKFSAFYVKDNKVIAVLGIATDPTVSLSAELLYGMDKYTFFAKADNRGEISTSRYIEVRDGYQRDGFTRRSSSVTKRIYTHNILMLEWNYFVPVLILHTIYMLVQPHDLITLRFTWRISRIDL